MTSRLGFRALAIAALVVAAFAGLAALSSSALAAEGAKAAAGAAGAKAGELQNSRAVALVFWMFAVMVIGGSLFVITRRNMITAVMGMVGTFFAIAGLYVMLYAHFIAAIQVLVYAGAIMVLFVFVVMILNRPEDEPFALTGLVGKVLAGGALLYLLVRLGSVLWKVREVQPATPAPGFGSTQSLGRFLFRDYLFPFEAVSLVLLVAVVGAIAVARPSVTAGSAAEAEAEAES